MSSGKSASLGCAGILVTILLFLAVYGLYGWSHGLTPQEAVASGFTLIGQIAAAGWTGLRWLGWGILICVVAFFAILAFFWIFG